MSDPAAPAPADVEAFADVLRNRPACEHEDRALATSHEVFVCYSCDATALLASPALATLRAHERANALRDAADAIEPDAYPIAPSVQRWLRDRADRQESTP